MKPDQGTIVVRNEQLSWDWQKQEWLLSCDVVLDAAGHVPEEIQLRLSCRTHMPPPTNREELARWVLQKLDENTTHIAYAIRSSRG